MNLGIKLVEISTNKSTITMSMDEFKRLEKLAQIGKATEALFEEENIEIFINPCWHNGDLEYFDEVLRRKSELLHWAESEED